MIYLDTSALLKWYIAEPSSDQVAAFIESHEDLAISRLTLVEGHCALNQRGRAFRRLEADSQAALAAFRTDVEAGLFTLFPVLDEDLIAADALLSVLTSVPLRTLDAVHLAIAQRRQMQRFATSDLVLARAAQSLGFAVHHFAAE